MRSKAIKEAFFESLRVEDAPDEDQENQPNNKENHPNNIKPKASFLSFVQDKEYNSEPFSLKELFQTLSLKESTTLWDLTRDKLMALLANPENIELAVLDGIVAMVRQHLNKLPKGKAKNKKVPDSLFEIMEVLHGNLLDLSTEAFDLQNHISLACEMWWSKDLPDRESLMPQTVTYLLIRSLEETAVKSDVLRMYALRDALKLFDYDDESSDTIKHLLLKCTISPLFLRVSEGQRFLSYIFTLSLPFVEQIHGVVKQQLPNCRPSLLALYGEMYYRTWLKAEGDLLLKLEYACIQDLMHSGVHVGVARTAKSVRKVLDAFHQKKKHSGVDEMLSRLYEPIMWRALNAANAIVRRNAASLFMEAFPLINPEDRHEDTDIALQKQFDHLLDLLSDSDVKVRMVGVQAVCKVLGDFWELLPPATTKVLILKLINDVSFDASCNGVRAAVFHGLRHVLHNHLSHPILKKTLPQLAPLIHDKSPTVQLAFLDMLLSIKMTRSIQFFDVVDADELLLRLEDCQPTVAKKITQLLMESYFPYNESLKTQLQRAVKVLKKHPESAKLFFSHVHYNAPVEAIYKLIRGLHKFLKQNLVAKDKTEQSETASKTGKKKARKGAKRSKTSTNADELAAPEGLSMWEQDKALVENVLCAMAQLWHSVSAQIDSEARDELIKSFEDGAIESLLETCQSDVARVAILTLATNLPSESMADVSDNTVPNLKQLTATSPDTEYGPLLECLFAWNRQDQAVSLICDGLEIGFGLKKASRKRNDINATPAVVVHYLTYILENNRSRAWLLNQCLEEEKTNNKKAERTRGQASVLRLKQLLDGAFSHLKGGLEETSKDTDADFLLSAFSLACKLDLHLHAARSFASSGKSGDSASTTGMEGERADGALIEKVLKMLEFADTVLPNLISASSTSDKPKKPTRRSGRKKASKASKDVEEPTDLLSGFILFLGKFCIELVTLGLDAQQRLLPSLLGWAAMVSEHIAGEGQSVSASSAVTVPPAVEALVGVMYKLLYQLALQMGMTVAALSLKLVEDNLSKLFAALLSITSPGMLQGETGVLVNNCLAEVIRASKARKSSLEFVIRLFLDNLPSRQEGKSTTTASLDPLSKTMLLALVRSPNVVIRLPQVVEAMHSELPASTASEWVGGLARALTTMKILSEDYVRQLHGQKVFNSSMQECSQFLLREYRPFGDTQVQVEGGGKEEVEDQDDDQVVAMLQKLGNHATAVETAVGSAV